MRGLCCHIRLFRKRCLDTTHSGGRERLFEPHRILCPIPGLGPAHQKGLHFSNRGHDLLHDALVGYFYFCSLGHIDLACNISLVVLSKEPEFHETSEPQKKMRSWRQSERKMMVETVDDLIRESHKHAKSQYTQSGQRAKWTRLAGQLIWYKDQILKNYSLEAMEEDMERLKKMVLEKNREIERKRVGYPTIVIPKPDPAKRLDPEGAKENALKTA